MEKRGKSGKQEAPVALVCGPGPGFRSGFDDGAGAAVDRCDQGRAQRLGRGGNVNYGLFPRGFQTIIRVRDKDKQKGVHLGKGTAAK